MRSANNYEVRKVLNQVIRRIHPDARSIKAVDKLIKRINTLLEENNIRAGCVAGGSYAKGTILKNDFDIDLFVRFDYSYKEKDKDLSRMLGRVLKPLRPELVHGSRDYYQLRRAGLLFEVVPVLRINDYKKAVNVTDMSSLHVAYVKKKLKKRPGLADQIRLAKQFCKSARVYGAESYIKGFSGHVLDLLIIHYKGFENLLMQACVWGSRVIIDSEKHLKDPIKQLNKSKTQSPLIIVDPIQPDRNAAAAISREKFGLLKKRAKSFLEKPSPDFFKVKKLSIKELRRKSGDNWLIIAKARPLKGKKDVVGAKIMKCFEHISKHLKKYDFKILESGWEFGQKQSLIYFIIKKQSLPSTVTVRGPPLKARKNAARFRSKHKNVFEKNKRLYAKEKREYKQPLKLVRSLAENDYVKQRVAGIKVKQI